MYISVHSSIIHSNHHHQSERDPHDHRQMGTQTYSHISHPQKKNGILKHAAAYMTVFNLESIIIEKSLSWTGV